MRIAKLLPLLVVCLLVAVSAGADVSGVKLIHRDTSKYVVLSNGAPSATGTVSTSAENFALTDTGCLLPGDTVSVRAANGSYLTVSGSDVNANGSGAGEPFVLQEWTSSPIVRNASIVSLRTNGGYYLCPDAAGVLRATCTAPVNSTYFKVESTALDYPALVATPTVNPTPQKAGNTSYISATPSGGPNGITKYRFIVRQDGTGTQIADSGEQTSSMFSWSTPSTAGTYDITHTVIRYCGTTKITEASATTNNYKTSKVAFSTPAAGTTLAPGSTVQIQWSGGVAGTARLYYYDGTTRTADITPNLATVDLVSGSYAWRVPSNVAATASGKILIMSTTTSSMQWESGLFNVTAGTPLQWRWTTRLWPEHFVEAGVLLDEAHTQKLIATEYTIGGIINSGRTGGSPDRFFDTMDCSACHGSSGAKYRPGSGADAIVASGTSVARGDGTNYAWNQNSDTGVVYRFMSSSTGKPYMLEQLFKKWLNMGAQP